MKRNDGEVEGERVRCIDDPKGAVSLSTVRRERAVRMARQRKPKREELVPQVTKRMPPTSPTAPAFTLTQREREVAQLIAQSHTAKGIAAALGISVHTATRHTESIMRKMNVRSRVAVAAYVLRQSLLD